MSKLVELRKKLKSKKGFTLMEMLIVVAIIVVLLAIAIPSFNNSLNKAKTTADEANVRSYYAEVMVENMDKTTITPAITGDITQTMKDAGYELQAKDAKVTAAGTTVEDFKLTYHNAYIDPDFVVGNTSTTTPEEP